MLSRFLASLFAVIILVSPGAAFADDETASESTVASTYTQIQEQGIIFANICTGPDDVCSCRDVGDCTLEDMLQVAVNGAMMILAISGSLFLLMIIYGGIMWIAAHGNSAWVDKGKQTLINASIGLGIILLSYTAITFVVKILRTGELPTSEDTLESVTGSDSFTTVNE